MAEILFLFDVSHCLCLCAADRSIRPFKTVTDFKFDVHIPRESPDMTP